MISVRTSIKPRRPHRHTRHAGITPDNPADQRPTHDFARDPEAVENLVLDLGLPLSLPDIGVRSEHFLGLAEEVMQDLVVAESPREVSREDVIEILASAS